MIHCLLDNNLELAVGADKCSIVSECALDMLSICSLYATPVLSLPQRDPYEVESVFVHLHPHHLYSLLPHFLLNYLYYPPKYRLRVLYEVGCVGVSVYV